MYPLAGYEVGSVFAGRFQILSLLGVGGYGAVFMAVDLARDGREVAVKLIAPTQAATPWERGELQIQRRIDHPNVLRIFEGGLSPDGIAYLVMEYLAGCTLRDCLDAAPNGMPLDEALAVLTAIASALADTHQRDVAHCDVKPSNVLLSRNGQVKLSDFGAARFWKEEQPPAVPASLVGTPQYMAPELLSGGTVGPAVDVFAFGSVAFELLTGRSAFDGSDLPQLLARYRRRYPLTRRDIPVGVPGWLRRLIIDCCASDPSIRPEDGTVLSGAMASQSYASQLHRHRWRWLTALVG